MDVKALLKRFGIYGKLILEIFKVVKLTKKQKLLLGAGLTYLLSPIDLIPGFIPVLGQLDDIIVALAVLIKVLKELSPEDRNSHLEKFAVTLEMIEEDLKMAKALAYQLAKGAVHSTGKALYAGGKVAYRLALRGAATMTKMAFDKKY